MLDVRYSHLYFYQSLNRLQRGLSAIAELLVSFLNAATPSGVTERNSTELCGSEPDLEIQNCQFVVVVYTVTLRLKHEFGMKYALDELKNLNQKVFPTFPEIW